MSRPDALSGAVRHLVLCGQCDLLVRLPARAAGQQADCPRCQHHLTGPARRSAQAPLAWAVTALIMLGLVFAFPFLGFSTHGVNHVMGFADTVGTLGGDHYGALAAILLATTVIFPGLYLIALIYLCIGAGHKKAPGSILLARALRPLEPWLMSDVFIVGVLVSLVKIVSLAQVHIHLAFYAFCAYALLLLYTLSLIDWITLWNALAPIPQPPPRARPGASGRSQSLVSCRACETPFSAARHRRCPRCGRRRPALNANRIQITWALLVTAAILYIPANAYPIMYTSSLGQEHPQTIAGGVLLLARSGDWPIAAVIFVASIIIPISKIVALSWLCIAAGRQPNAALARTRAYRVTEKIGRWSMIDVFVVSVLATLVQAGALLSVHPGPGAVAFAGVVIVTMIAALTFDPRLLWTNKHASV